MASERSKSKSVFVGNIPHDSNEEDLKKFFGQVGPVVNFRMMREADGRSKGYGFCEYHDKETAEIALKNLNNLNFNGRTLRVAEATGDQNKESHKDTHKPSVATVKLNISEDQVKPGDLPEIISKTVARLAPERIFEILRELQVFIRDKPNEARELLTRNPQLTYAMLQAGVVSKLIEPTEALKMLHPKGEFIAPIMPKEGDQESQDKKEILQGLPCFGLPDHNTFGEDRSQPNSLPIHNSVYPVHQSSLGHHESAFAIHQAPIKEPFNDCVPLVKTSMSSGNVEHKTQRLDHQMPVTQNNAYFGLSRDVDVPRPINSVFGESRHSINAEVKAEESWSLNQSYENQIGPNRNYAVEEMPSQKFYDGRFREERSFKSETQPANNNQRQHNNHYRPNMEDPRTLNRRFENQNRPNRGFNMEEYPNQNYYDNQYKPNRAPNGEEPINHSFNNQFRPNRDHYKVTDQRQHQGFENEYRPPMDFTREVEFGEDRPRHVTRTRDHERSNRFSSHPYEHDSRRYDSERHLERRRQPQQQQQTRENNRRPDNLPPPVQNASSIDPNLLAEILNLPENKVAELTPEARQTVMMLKQQMSGKK